MDFRPAGFRGFQSVAEGSEMKDWSGGDLDGRSVVLAAASFARALLFPRYWTPIGPRLALALSCERICRAITCLSTDSFRPSGSPGGSAANDHDARDLNLEPAVLHACDANRFLGLSDEWVGYRRKIPTRGTCHTEPATTVATRFWVFGKNGLKYQK
jgi:hypothetical protein